MRVRPFLAITMILIMFSPYIAWRMVEDIRYTSGLNSWIADRYGVSVAQVHPAIFDAAAAHMPLHARYYLATAPDIDSTRREAFEQWAAGWLLPRIATSTVPKDGWILTLGVKPFAVDSNVKRTWRIWPAVNGTPAAYLGQGGFLIDHALALLAGNLLFLAAGAGVARAVGVWQTPRGFLRCAALAYLLGIGATGVTLQLLLVLGLRFGWPMIVGTPLALAATGLIRRGGADPPPASWRPSRRVAPQMAIAAGMAGLMAVDLWFQPLGRWDAWAQWTAKARVIYLFHGLAPSILSTSPYYAMNPDYPTLLPAVEASDFTFMGAVDTRVIHLQFWLIFVATVVALVQLLTPKAKVAGWTTAALVAVTPAVQVLTASALADIPVAVFFAFAGLFAHRWLVDGDRVSLRLFALFAAAALATKFEGRIYVGALMFVLLIQIVRFARDRLLSTSCACAVALVGIVPWSLWVKRHHIRGIFLTSLSDRITFGLFSHLGRIPLSLGSLTRYALTPMEWLLPTLAIALAIFAAIRAGNRRITLELLGGTLVLIIAGLVFVYWATPLDPTWHLRQSGTRVISGPILFAVFLLPALIGEPAANVVRRMSTRRD